MNKPTVADLAPLIRIALFVLGGYLTGQGYDENLIRFIQTDPELVGTIILALTGGWYALAKWLGWKR